MATDTIDVIIIGGGAAGLMCAIEAARRGRSVLVLEHSDAVGKKILISGGGRCNFTNTYTTPDNFISENPHFPKSALSRYTPDDFISMVRRHHIAYHEKKLGQLFCDGSSQQIIKMLQWEYERAGVKVLLSCQVTGIQKDSGKFLITTQLGIFHSASLVIATGGLSVPKMGASDFGYKVARQFGLRVTETRAGLVPLTLTDPKERGFCELSGVSLDAIVKWNRVSFRENVLFTHRGLSGPAILQISSYWKPGDSIIINAMPEPDSAIPKRFLRKWQAVYQESTEQLRQWTLRPGGSEGFAKAEVTTGGIDTRQLSSKTMEALNVPGLYFIGEVVDVTGHLGGFNFQWAWASGYVAGQYA